ncbi:unnamed protein product [Rotaria sp. Silwood1]|nr:unnamed protein product [Rotaria sp. Silwood1]CAF0842063.1 unnamed protein product [Rotaria sp. Silwood1]
MEEAAPSRGRLLLCVLCAYLMMTITAVLGIAGQFFYWLIFDLCGFGNRQTNRKLHVTTNQKEDEYYALIIGSGFSGLGMAIKLKQLGTDNFIVIERHEHVGGTWYANKYPGCACDVPSNLYSFSFEPNPNWSYFFSRQTEIGDYLEHCTDKYDIRRHIKFHTTVTKLKWIDDKQLWEITIQSSDNQEKQIYAQFIIAGYGPLSNASYPNDIPGIDKFQGQMCHTAEWNKNIDFTNKQKRIFKRFPIIQKFIRAFIYWVRESAVLSFTYRLPIRHAFQRVVKYDLYRQVKDKELRKKLTPSYDLGCKRVLLSDDWYSSMQQPNVKLITNRIQEIKSNSIVTRDGDEYPVDIIIWSTGFQVQNFSLPVYGINGRSLKEQWSQTFQAYRGVTVPNFPNLFFLLGPNTGLGHNSIIVMIEAQINYIAEALLYVDEKNVRMLDVKQNVHDEYNQKIQSNLKKTVWQSGGCHSWYQDSKGNNTAIWPGFTWTYILFMKYFDPTNYTFQ